MSVDRLTPAELRAMTVEQQLGVLDFIFGEIKRLSDLRCEAVDLHADARMRCIDDPSSDNKRNVIDAKRSIEKSSVMLACRKSQASILQTALRAVPN